MISIGDRSQPVDGHTIGDSVGRWTRPDALNGQRSAGRRAGACCRSHRTQPPGGGVRALACAERSGLARLLNVGGQTSRRLTRRLLAAHVAATELTPSGANSDDAATVTAQRLSGDFIVTCLVPVSPDTCAHTLWFATVAP